MTDQMKILVVDDEVQICNILKMILKDYSVVTANRGEEALKLFREDPFDMVISDVKMPGMTGLELFENFKAEFPQTPFIFVTAYENIDDVTKALRLGAADYIRKPFSMEEIRYAVHRVLETRRMKTRLEALEEEVKDKYSFQNIIGKCKQMQQVFQLIRTVAETDATVLITGETGTGKEMVARAVHYQSHRRQGPFLAINCSAIPETLMESELFGHEKGSFTGAHRQKLGKFELAKDGTLFLDEIGEIPLSTQVKLLRVLQQKEFERVGGEKTIKADVRIIAATNKDLMEEINAGRFREDLYYRLNVINITLPPLRERQEDIPHLVKHFLKKYGETYGKPAMDVSDACRKKLINNDWPGNVRELENLIERAVIMSPDNIIEDISGLSAPSQPAAPVTSGASEKNPDISAFEAVGDLPTLKDFVEEAEKVYLERLLRETNGIINHSCRVAEVNQKTLYNKMQKYGLDRKAFR